MTIIRKYGAKWREKKQTKIKITFTKHSTKNGGKKEKKTKL